MLDHLAEFQSTPDLVNRENRRWRGLVKRTHWFQSTPDLVNRENTQTRRKRVFFAPFQSTPDLVNRENALHLMRDLKILRFNPLPI